MEITTDEFLKKFNELDPKLQDILNSDWYIARIIGIGKKNKIPDKLMGEITRATTLHLMGLLQKGDMVPQLQRKLGISTGNAQVLGDEIESIILNEIEKAEKANESDEYIKAYYESLNGSQTGLNLIDDKLGTNLGDNKQNAPAMQTPPIPTAPILPSSPQQTEPQPQKRYPEGSDPYREPAA